MLRKEKNDYNDQSSPYLNDLSPVAFIIVWAGDGFVGGTSHTALRRSDAFNGLIILIQKCNVQAHVEGITEELPGPSCKLPTFDAEEKFVNSCVFLIQSWHVPSHEEKVIGVIGPVFYLLDLKFELVTFRFILISDSLNSLYLINDRERAVLDSVSHDLFLRVVTKELFHFHHTDCFAFVCLVDIYQHHHDHQVKIGVFPPFVTK